MNTHLTENQTYVDGHKIAFRETGEGMPLILIHGIPTSSLMWRDILPKLTSRRAIALDLLNYGQSDKPENADVSINAQSRIVLHFMDALGVYQADVVAHDIGGGVAQLLAVTHPERVRKLVLMDSVCFDSWPISEFEKLQEPRAEADMSLEDFVGIMRGFMPNGVNNRDAMTEQVIDLYIEPWSSEDGKRAFFRNLRRLNKEYTQAIADELRNLPHETLVMWGEHDPFQKPEYAEKLTESIPRAELAWIRGAGHWLTEDKPDEVADGIAQFLG